MGGMAAKSEVLFLLRFFLATMLLAGCLLVIKIDIPILLPISLAIFAIALALLTIFVYPAQLKQFLPLGRTKFIVLLLIQIAFSISMLVITFYRGEIYLYERTESITTLFKASIVTGGIFLIILYLILTYNNKFTQFVHISPFVLIGIFLPNALTQTSFITYFSICRCGPPVFGVFIMAVVLAYQLFIYRLFLVSPFERRLIVDSMKLGWMIVDENQIIRDVNAAAERILEQSRDELIGQPGGSLIGNWNTLFPDSFLSEKEMQASIRRENGAFSYIQVHSLPILQGSEYLGRVLIWSDITDRKKGDDIRKSTLNATLGLLQSISLAASHSMDVNSFLESVIYQIVSNFNCTIGFIFMREAEFFGEEKAPLEFVSAYSARDFPGIEQMAQPLSVSLALLDDILHINTDELFSPSDLLKFSDNMEDAVLCPIIIESMTQGGIVLFRTQKTPFRPDEIVRLEMLTNELSTLIHVEMQRHGYASMLERKKITRILHDTVTQQLYGLLYFIDLAQAQLDSGTISTLSATLDRLGGMGRQALKEMRMFLYSLQPVNVAKVGFVAAIRHRLEAVEGRASIKTQFIVKPGVSLTLKQDICLYEIGLEALNNILRHASAQNVFLTLKQNPKNIQFEIVDDGCGFDVSARKNSGGLGLQNMRESARRIHAKIVIRSTVGGGSTIKILIPRAGVLSPEEE